MAKIEAGNVEVYIRQLLSEALVKNVDPANRATDEKILEDENFFHAVFLDFSDNMFIFTFKRFYPVNFNGKKYMPQ